ncbi:MAG: histidine phosphatase family protein [Isosphaeraceae bacterium]
MTQHGALGSLAGAGHAEEEVSPVLGRIVVRRLLPDMVDAHRFSSSQGTQGDVAGLGHHAIDSRRSPPDETRKGRLGLRGPPALTDASIFLDHQARSKTLEETRLLLIRHAETSAPDIFHGAESDIGLSEWGRQQAERLGERLKSVGASALYCSALRRASDTAAAIGTACGLEPTIIPPLHERRIGPLSGLSRQDGWEIYAESKRNWMAGELAFTNSGGESFADILHRVLPVIESLRDRHPGGTVIVVAHGIVIRVLLLSLLEGYTPADFDRIAIDFASINDLRWDKTRWRAVSLNEQVAPSASRPVA